MGFSFGWLLLFSSLPAISPVCCIGIMQRFVEVLIVDLQIVPRCDLRIIANPLANHLNRKLIDRLGLS